jgi:hypothetical protein
MDEAGGYVTALQREGVDSWAAATMTCTLPYRAPPSSSPARAAQRRVRAALRYLPDRPFTRETRRLVELLAKDLSEAGGEVTPSQRRTGRCMDCAPAGTAAPL